MAPLTAVSPGVEAVCCMTFPVSTLLVCGDLLAVMSQVDAEPPTPRLLLNCWYYFCSMIYDSKVVQGHYLKTQVNY